MLPIALGALNLNSSETRIYLYMMSLANGRENCTCFPSNNTLVSRLNISESQAKRSRKRLEELGLIKVVCKGGRSAGNRYANTYKVFYPVVNIQEKNLELDYYDDTEEIEELEGLQEEIQEDI